MASITTNVTWAPTRCSRSANTWLVTEPHVVTVDVVPARPPPAIRTQTFASRLDTSSPAQRGWTISITATSSSMSTTNSRCPSRGGQEETEV